MTIPSTSRKAGPLLGTGAQTAWPFTFKVFAASDIAVTIADSLGIETPLVLDTDYSVTLNANQETSPGGTVTYPISGSPLAVGSKLSIIGDLDYDQPLDLPSGGNFSPLALENQLDRMTMQLQQLEERLSRALLVPVNSTADVQLPNPEANELIGWDSTGDNLANYALSELATGIAYGTMRFNTFVGDGTTTQFALTEDPAALANLDVSIGGVTQVPGTDYTLTSATLVFTTAPVNGVAILARYGRALPIVGPTDSSAVTHVAAGAGAVATTVQAKLRESVSIEDFGGAAGAGDNTAAMNAAATYLNGLGGGVILIPYVGNWLMNWVCLYNNITVQGVGGDGEYSTTVIRPYNISSAAITFGDGTTIVRYCGLQYVHISGTDGTVSGQTLVANNAPHALRLRGGVINFTADRVVLYNGVKSLSLEPSATQPVTGVRFNNGTIRNDIANSANARCIYMVRFADPGYCTDNKINQTKVNSTTIGYAAEIDGSAVGIAFEVSNSYWDIKPGYGVLLKGASQLIGFNTQLDPGALGAIVIEADSNGDISRFIVGYFRNGGQKFKTPLYTWTLPVEADTFSYKARLNTPYLSPLVFLSQQEDPYNETVFFDRTSTSNTAPVRLNGADFYVAKDVYGYGGNGSTAWYLAANSAGGGAYLAALGTNQNIRLVPSGTGSNIMAGAGTYPSGDNTQPLGLAGGRWSVVYAGTGTINTSDAREKQQIRSLSDAENAVAVRLKSLIKAFKFSDAVQAKGDAARIHVGVIAQEVIAAFEAEGLDANRYAIVCYDEWEAQAEEFVPEVIDEHGQVISPCRHTPAIPAGNRYGVRYEELLAFIISAL